MDELDNVMERDELKGVMKDINYIQSFVIVPTFLIVLTLLSVGI